MIAKLFWDDGDCNVATLSEGHWTVEPEDPALQEALQDLFDKAAKVAMVVGSDATAAGIRHVINTYKPDRVERKPGRDDVAQPRPECGAPGATLVN